MANILTININNIEIDSPDFYFKLNEIFKDILNKCKHKKYRNIDIGYNGTCIIHFHTKGVNLNTICSKELKEFLNNNENYCKIINKICVNCFKIV